MELRAQSASVLGHSSDPWLCVETCAPFLRVSSVKLELEETSPRVLEESLPKDASSTCVRCSPAMARHPIPQPRLQLLSSEPAALREVFLPSTLLVLAMTSPTNCESSVTLAELLNGLLLPTSPLLSSTLLLTDDYCRRAHCGDTIPKHMGLG
ncbi:hypothetical protein STEG23_004570, partial [Scotinomys teguina]